MMDTLFQIGFSNAVVAMLLAGFTLMVGLKVRNARVLHLLWMVVLLKLLTPPLYQFDVEWPLENFSAAATSLDGVPTGGGPDWVDAALLEPALPEAIGPLESAPTTWLEWNSIQWALGAAWLAGLIILFAVSAVRIFRFNRRLQIHSRTVPAEVSRQAALIARRLQIRTLPDIRVTAARLSPLVWWLGGRVQIVVPQRLIEQLDTQQLRWVIAHEMAHVSRRDYLVRWLEWITCITFWWNPVVWIAKRNLRTQEEICCDELVLKTFRPGKHSYANSILTAVESLVRPAFRPPAVASEINSGGFLKRRIEMIMSGKSNWRQLGWVHLGMVAAALFLLPLGIAGGQDLGKVEKRLAKMVDKGQLTEEQVDVMMRALVEFSERKASERRENSWTDELRDRLENREREARREQERNRWVEEREHQNRIREYEEIERQIHQATRKGDLAPEDAERKLMDLRRELLGDHGEREHVERVQEEERVRLHDMLNRLEAEARELRHAAQAAEVGRAAAQEQLHALQRQLEQMHASKAAKQRSERNEQEKRKADLMKRFEATQARLTQASKEGLISEEEAHEKLAAMKQELAKQLRQQATSEDVLRAGEKKIKELIESGRINESQAKQQLEMLKKRLGEGARQRQQQAEAEREQALAKLTAMATDLKNAVQAGDIAKDEAAERLVQIERKMADLKGSRKAPQKWSADQMKKIGDKIRQAVEAGDISPEEGRKKMQAIRKELGEPRDR